MAAMPTVSKSLLLFPFLLFLILMPLATSQPPFVKYYCIDSNGNYTANSTFKANLNTLLSNLISNTEIDYGFYNFSKGQNPDKVNIIGMCRGYVAPEDCRSCLNNSRVLLTQSCPNQKEAIGWYDECMLRYSNRSIFGVRESKPTYYIYNLENATNADKYNQVVSNMLGNLTARAAAGDSHRKFAAEKQTSSIFQDIFAHVQCTPDLSELECNQCLFGEISIIPKVCAGKVRCRIFQPSCNLRFDTKPYFVPTSDVLTPPEAPSPLPSITATTKEDNSWRIVIPVVVPVVSVIILLTFICIYSRIRPGKSSESESEADYEIEPTETMQFNFQTIIDSTNNFSDANKLGQGGFGPVYKGRLPNGEEVAIKRLSRNSNQGDTEFENELLLVAKLQHRNLVKLLGFCLQKGERILVYEFLSNRSLDYFIFDPSKGLDWERRYKIVEGIARGLLYLHEDSQLRIIHRDLKASNILLDEEMNAKISDFGMAKLFVADQTQGNTLIVRGTYGYMAPEYAVHGEFSVKSDVFSFGVLALEIVTGHKNSYNDNGDYAEHLISLAWRKWREGTVLNIVDPTLNNNSRNEIMRCIHIALLCVQENVASRPTMATVVLMFNSHSLSLPIPSEPAYLMNARGPLDSSPSESRSNNIPNQVSTYEASISELDPR